MLAGGGNGPRALEPGTCRSKAAKRRICEVHLLYGNGNDSTMNDEQTSGTPCADTSDRAATRTMSRPIQIGFQIRLMVKVGLLLAAGVLLTALVFWVFAVRLEAHTYVEALQDINEFRLALLYVTILSALGQVALVGALIAVVALLASHKIAGPLIRFGRCLDMLADGDLRQKVGFRRGDQDQSLPQAFHALSQRLRGRVSAAEGAASNLRELHVKLSRRADAGSITDEEAALFLDEMREQAEKLRAAGSFEGEAHES